MPDLQNEGVRVIAVGGGITEEVSLDLEVLIKDGNTFFRMCPYCSHDDYFSSFVAPECLKWCLIMWR